MLFSGVSSDLFGERGGGMSGDGQGVLGQSENVTINIDGDDHRNGTVRTTTADR